MGVVARAKEGHDIWTVFGGQPFKVGANCGFGLTFGQIELFGAHFRRNIGKKAVQIAHPNHGEHLVQLFLRMGDIWHICSLNMLRVTCA